MSKKKTGAPAQLVFPWTTQLFSSSEKNGVERFLEHEPTGRQSAKRRHRRRMVENDNPGEETMTTFDYRHPFVLLPNRVWRPYHGGMMLDRIEGQAECRDSHLTEDWVGSAMRAISSSRPDGPVADEGLSHARTDDGGTVAMDRLIAADPEAALGAPHVAAFGTNPQVLVRLIDTAHRLSIQAHPSAAWARENLDSEAGKTEAWWVTGTRGPESWVLAGFQRPPTREAWRRMMADMDSDGMAACFDRIPVVAGDVLVIEGGLPHTIGAGAMVIELAEPTDFVVRCEFADKKLKVSEADRTMGLGVDRTVDMFDFTSYPADEVKKRFGPVDTVLHEAVGGGETLRIGPPRTDLFEARQIVVNGRYRPEFDGRHSIVIVLEGGGTLTAGGRTTPLSPWTRLFWPAALDEVEIEGRVTLARCMPPRPKS